MLAARDDDDKESDLSMQEIQGRQGVAGIQLCNRATVVLNACNTGRGDIRAEGVVGLARGFLFTNALATVVFLWSVSSLSLCANTLKVEMNCTFFVMAVTW